MPWEDQGKMNFFLYFLGYLGMKVRLIVERILEDIRVF